MKKYINLSSHTGRIVLILLMVFDVYIWFVGRYTFWMVLLNLTLLTVTYYILHTKVTIALGKARMADSFIRMSNHVLDSENELELFNRILKEVVHTIDPNGIGSLMSINPDNSILYQAAVGFDVIQLNTLNLQLEDTYLYNNTQNGDYKTVVANKITEYNISVFDKVGFEFVEKQGLDKITYTVSAPILLDHQLIGILNVDSTRTKGISPSNIKLINAYSVEISKVIHLHKMIDNAISQAKYDHLTNAVARGHFMSIMEKIMNDSKLCPPKFVIVYIDLDGLKVVNDRYGHEVGDLYLTSFVKTMRKHLRGEEMISRFGGDEFLLLMLREEEEVWAYIETCNQFFREHTIEVADQQIRVRFSLGMAQYPDDSRLLKALINIADEKMYKDKHS